MIKSHSQKEFCSKVDWWLMVLLVAAVVYPVVIGVYTLITDHKHGLMAFFMTLGSAALVFLVLRLLAFPIKYTIAEGQVRIRAGYLIRKNIDIAQIAQIYSTRNPLSSPALSLDRLAVCSQRDGKLKLEVLISPEEKSEFLIFLTNVDDKLFFDGTKLTRRL